MRAEGLRSGCHDGDSLRAGLDGVLETAKVGYEHRETVAVWMERTGVGGREGVPCGLP